MAALTARDVLAADAAAMVNPRLNPFAEICQYARSAGGDPVEIHVLIARGERLTGGSRPGGLPPAARQAEARITFARQTWRPQRGDRITDEAGDVWTIDFVLSESNLVTVAVSREQRATMRR